MEPFLKKYIALAKLMLKEFALLWQSHFKKMHCSDGIIFSKKLHFPARLF